MHEYITSFWDVHSKNRTCRIRFTFESGNCRLMDNWPLPPSIIKDPLCCNMNSYNKSRHVCRKCSVDFNIMKKTQLKQWWSTITAISSKRTIIYHLNSPKMFASILHMPMFLLNKNYQQKLVHFGLFQWSTITEAKCLINNIYCVGFSDSTCSDNNME
jgi:hypothetical protein